MTPVERSNSGAPGAPRGALGAIRSSAGALSGAGTGTTSLAPWKSTGARRVLSPQGKAADAGGGGAAGPQPLRGALRPRSALDGVGRGDETYLSQRAGFSRGALTPSPEVSSRLSARSGLRAEAGFSGTRTSGLLAARNSDRVDLSSRASISTRSANVPNLLSASAVGARSFRVRDVLRVHRDHHHDYSPHFYGSYGSYGYPFGFSFGVSFGYPYYSHYGHHWSAFHSVHIGFPYVGYYYSYPYPYFARYSYYDCDYYDGFYVRFGAYRSSYYADCSGHGRHSYHHHHCHHHSCSTHGSHSYHVRDCTECYPAGAGHYASDLEAVPEGPAGLVEASPTMVEQAPAAAADGVALEPDLPAAASDGTPLVRRLEPTPETVIAEAAPTRALDRQEAFFASLRPAQLSFALGLLQFRSGNYDEGVESFYNASLEDPESKLVKVFLAIGLFAVGESGFAAEYLRHGLEEWPAFPSYQWSVRGLYGNQDDLARHLALLEDGLRHNPGDTDAALVLAFLGMNGITASSTATGEALDRVRALSSNPVDQTLASRLVAETEARAGLSAAPALALPEMTLAVVEEDPAVAAFLASLELKDVPALPIH